MRKFFTLLMALCVVAGASAESVVYLWENYAKAKSLTLSDGAVLEINTTADKTIQGSAKVTFGTYKNVTVFKFSNGQQNKFTAPEGKYITKVTFYAYVNNATLENSYWSEVNGTSYTLDQTAIKATKTDLANLDVQSFDLPYVTSFTFNNKGKQICAGLEIEYTSELPAAPAAPVLKVGEEEVVSGVIAGSGTEDVTVTLSHENAEAEIYYCFEPVAQGEAPAARVASIEHEGKTFTLHDGQPLTFNLDGTLHYFAQVNGVKSEVKSVNISGTTGVEVIEAGSNAPVEYYNLQGVKVENPVNGLYIIKQGNTVSKVLVK